jgi:hypothetical protein
LVSAAARGWIIGRLSPLMNHARKNALAAISGKFSAVSDGSNDTIAGKMNGFAMRGASHVGVNTNRRRHSGVRVLDDRESGD